MTTAAADPLVLSGLAMATSAELSTDPPPGVTRIPVAAEATPMGPGKLSDRPSTIVVDTVTALLEHAPGTGEWSTRLDCPADRRGLVLGSGTAGIDQSVTLTVQSLTRARPFNVNPALVPACVMNYAPSQCAIRFDLRGPNVTVTAGRVTGLAALGYADRLLRRDRADLVICGAFEDLNERRATVAVPSSADAIPGEGCCVFLAQRASRADRLGAPRLAELVALSTGVCVDGLDRAEVVGEVIGRAFGSGSVGPDDVGTVVLSSESDQLDAALSKVGVTAERVDCGPMFGDVLGATAAFQLAVALLGAETDSGRAGLVLVLTTDPDGQVGCALLRGAD